MDTPSNAAFMEKRQQYRKYNDVVNWQWNSLLHTMGDLTHHRSRSYTVKTADELSALLEDEHLNKADKIQLVEVVMNKHDAPRALEEQAKLTGASNQYTLV